MRPKTALHPSTAACLFAVIAGHTTVRAVADEVGLAISSTFRQLRKLRTLGLVNFADGKQATIRPNVAIVQEWGDPESRA